MKKNINIAIIGATGAVGRTMIEILEERNFPVDNIYLLASEKSAGEAILFKNKSIIVKDLSSFDFSNTNIALFSAGGDISAKYAPKAAEQGAVVIDNTSQFRYDDDVPLVISEVNPHAIANYKSRGIIANPNCSTMQMLVALKPIHEYAKIKRIDVATYQAVSGSGKKAIKELADQTISLLNAKDIESKVYPKQIAFNILPHIDVFLDNGYTKEEMKMVWETHKILEDDSIVINPTAARVPVFYGHSEAIHLETERKITADDAKMLLEKAEGVQVIDNPSNNEYPTPVIDATGEDAVFVGRIRENISCDYGLNLWVVSDNIRKGAALNTVQIAEILLQKYL